MYHRLKVCDRLLVDLGYRVWDNKEAVGASGAAGLLTAVVIPGGS